MNKLPEAVIAPRSRFSIVWVVPLVAVAIGAWLAYKAWSEAGPVITIVFKTAEGLEAGKTKIKYKNVEIGSVNTIRVSEHLDEVVVTAELVKSATHYLTEKTRFWVVRARAATTGVSGLDTLFSGAYIGIDPITEAKRTLNFRGLDEPPVVTHELRGRHFVLQADSLGSFEIGSPVYYRKFDVGQVLEFKLNDDGTSVTVSIFVRAPYDEWINHSTRFWNASGVNLSLNSEGVDLETQSLVSILIGGVAFETPDRSKDVEPSAEYAEFRLFASRELAFEKKYTIGSSFVMIFSESVRGLSVGAPVEFRGIPIGKVTDISMAFDPANREINIPVTVFFESGRLAFKGNSSSAVDLHARRAQTLDYFVRQGMRAQLKSGNLLTGQLYIDIDFFKDAPAYSIDWNNDPPEFPTVHSPLDELTQNVGQILKKLDKTMTQLNELSYKLNHTLAPELAETLVQTQNTLASIENTLKNESPLQQDTQFALKEIAKAARSVKTLADYLERHPESLIKGKAGQER